MTATACTVEARNPIIKQLSFVMEEHSEFTCRDGDVKRERIGGRSDLVKL